MSIILTENLEAIVKFLPSALLYWEKSVKTESSLLFLIYLCVNGFIDLSFELWRYPFSAKWIFGFLKL